MNAYMDTTAICNKITNDNYERTCPDASGSYDNCVTPGWPSWPPSGTKHPSVDDAGPDRGLVCEAYEPTSSYGHFTKGIFWAIFFNTYKVFLEFLFIFSLVAFLACRLRKASSTCTVLVHVAVLVLGKQLFGYFT